MQHIKANDMEDLIAKFELQRKISEREIASEFRKLLPENTDEISMELKAEIMAFDFTENSTNNESHFGPSVVLKNEKEEEIEYPSIKDITTEIIDYWTYRLNQTKNPILKSRYAGLVLEFSPLITGSKTNFEIGIEYIENLIATVESRNHAHDIDLIEKAKIAIQIAIKFNKIHLIEKAKNAIIKLENEIAINDKPGLWGFSYDILVGNSKINLNQEEETKIIESLMIRFEELSKEPNLNPWNAEAAAERIAKYYQKKENHTKVNEIIQKLGKVYEANEKNGNAMQILSWLQHLHKIYTDFGLKKEADNLLIKIRNIESKQNEELQLITSSFEIPNDKFDSVINHIIKGNSLEIFSNLIHYFTPKTEDIKERMFEQAKINPLYYLIQKNIIDNKGRIVATIGSLENDIEGNTINELSRTLSFQSIFLEPVLNKIIDNKIIDIKDFIDFIKKSPVFSNSRYPIIERGIQAYYNKDFIVAIHILIPQIEEAFRNLIQLNGGVVLKLKRQGKFQLKTFDEILRDKIIEKVLDKDIQLYLIVLFTDPRGWNLRNNVCHGISEIESFSFQSINRILHVMLILGMIRKEETSESM